MVENVHMKQRMMGIPFSIRARESKDKYIDSNLRNVLSELSADLVNYSADVVLRNLLMTSISLEIAQNIGIDYHAATEELYYYMHSIDICQQKNFIDICQQKNFIIICTRLIFVNPYALVKIICGKINLGSAR